MLIWWPLLCKGRAVKRKFLLNYCIPMWVVLVEEVCGTVLGLMLTIICRVMILNIEQCKPQYWSLDGNGIISLWGRNGVRKESHTCRVTTVGHLAHHLTQCIFGMIVTIYCESLTFDVLKSLNGILSVCLSLNQHLKDQLSSWNSIILNHTCSAILLCSLHVHSWYFNFT